MKTEEFRSIYKRVIRSTTAKAINWLRDGEDAFTVSFSKVTLDLIKDTLYNPPLCHLDIRNNAGIIVAYVCEDTLDVDTDYSGVGIVHVEESVAELFQLVVDQVYNFEEVIESLTMELDRIDEK